MEFVGAPWRQYSWQRHSNPFWNVLEEATGTHRFFQKIHLQDPGFTRCNKHPWVHRSGCPRSGCQSFFLFVHGFFLLALSYDHSPWLVPCSIQSSLFSQTRRLSWEPCDSLSIAKHVFCACLKAKRPRERPSTLLRCLLSFTSCIGPGKFFKNDHPSDIPSLKQT